MRTMETVVSIRPMTAADIPQVVSLQTAYLEGSIVTDLGAGFLDKFHVAALAHPSARALVAAEDSTLSGFALASIDVHAFNRYIKPRVLLPLVRALLAPRGLRLGGSIALGLVDRDPQPPIPAELLLLVVDSKMRRRGIGRRLLDTLEDGFRCERVCRYRVAVRSHLAVARAFYLATGFEPEQDLLVFGRPMTYLTKQVGS
jgi:ribosomal protein S18 acetylase RimI-like enzyme